MMIDFRLKVFGTEQAIDALKAYFSVIKNIRHDPTTISLGAHTSATFDVYESDRDSITNLLTKCMADLELFYWYLDEVPVTTEEVKQQQSINDFIARKYKNDQEES